MIEASHLSHRFGAVRALDDVSFSVARGEIAGFLGPNGAGKTTAMRILAGVLVPTTGRAAIAGFDTRRAPLEARRRLGYFAESAPCYPELPVGGYLGCVARLKGIPRGARAAAVDRVLAELELGAVRDRRCGALSRGYRQRVGLAQALLGDPAALILDEPTVGLDPEQAAALRERIAAMRAERAVLFSSHNLAEVQALCDRVLVMRGGRLVGADTPAALAARLRGGVRVRLRVEGPQGAVVALIGALPGVRAAELAPDGRVRLEAVSEDALHAAARALHDRGWTLLDVERQAPALEEAFLALVADHGRLP